MPTWLDTALDLLSQFTGTGGGQRHALVNFGVAAIFFGLLYLMARVSAERRGSDHSRLLAWGFAIALSREVVMLTVKIIEAYGWISHDRLHLVFPPLEHALSNIGLTIIAGVYAARLTGSHQRWMRFVRRGVTALAVIYVTTATWWAVFSYANPDVRFGQTWTDWAFRLTMSTLLGIVLIGLRDAPLTNIRRAVHVAMALFFVNEFLKIIDMAFAEQYEATFAVLRHTAYLAALPLLAYAFVKEQANALDQMMTGLEEAVARRTSELASVVDDLEAANLQLAETATTDVLTGLQNRRGVEQALRERWATAERTRQPVAVLMIDVDEFKAVNDEHGHGIGDDALATIAATLGRHARREVDAAGRRGGDEFVVGVFGATPDHVTATAAAIVEEVRAIVVPAAPDLRLSVSIGGSYAVPGDGRTLGTMFDLADSALYDVKEHGRDGFAIVPAPADQERGRSGPTVSVRS